MLRRVIDIAKFTWYHTVMSGGALIADRPQVSRASLSIQHSLAYHSMEQPHRTPLVSSSAVLLPLVLTYSHVINTTMYLLPCNVLQARRRATRAMAGTPMETSATTSADWSTRYPCRGTKHAISATNMAAIWLRCSPRRKTTSSKAWWAMSSSFDWILFIIRPNTLNGSYCTVLVHQLYIMNERIVYQRAIMATIASICFYNNWQYIQVTVQLS